jgi:AraC family transcriptional regulator
MFRRFGRSLSSRSRRRALTTAPRVSLHREVRSRPTRGSAREGGPRRDAPPTTPQELVRWVPATYELPLISRVDVHAFSGDLWDDVRVCRKVSRGPFVMPRGYVASDLVAVILNAPQREEGCFGSARIADRGGAGTINVLPAGMPYTYSCQGTREVLHLSLGRSSEQLDGDGARRPARLRPAFAAADPLVAQIALALLSEISGGGGAGRLYGEALGVALAAHLARRYASEQAAPARPPGRFPGRQLRRVLEYIEAHLGSDLGLSELARVAAMSRTRFLCDFRATVGTSPHRYVCERRVERAKALLARPDAQLHEIAVACGYADQTSFARVFRRIARMTPGAYRRATQ